MIFVTVGSLYPFDRLIEAADDAAGRLSAERFFAQVGDSAYKPRNMDSTRLLGRGEFRALVRDTQLIVAHAGMGSVLTAMEAGVPIILAPRRLDLGEHNTDHQEATARWLADRPGVHVCRDTAELTAMIQSVLSAPASIDRMSSTAPEPFLARLRKCIHDA